jgi:hypothetical protein
MVSALEASICRNAFKLCFQIQLVLLQHGGPHDILQLHGGAPIHGRAVQLDPIKPKLKPPGTKRLKLKHDEPLSTFAFNFSLRRYIMARTCTTQFSKVPYMAVANS